MPSLFPPLPSFSLPKDLRPPPCPLRLMDHPQLQNVARTLAFNSRLARQLQAHDKGASAAALQGSIEDLGSVIKSMMSL